MFLSPTTLGKQIRVLLTAVFVLAALLLFTGCNNASTTSTQTTSNDSQATARPAEYSIAVFVPAGSAEGSPVYEMMVEGVQKAVEELSTTTKVTVQTVNGGYDQSQWLPALTALASTSEFQLIVSSNPSIPELAVEVQKTYPQQKFLILDGDLEGQPGIKTIYFDKYTQAWVTGYFAALVSQSSIKGANPGKKIGLLAGQEYPVMNDQIRPGFLAGAKAVDPTFELDFRVLGNWYDAAKAAELGKSMIQGGVDVILPIAGSANEGIIQAAKESNTFVVWYDNSASAQAPGVILGSSLVLQVPAVTAAVINAVDNTLDYGRTDRLGLKEGAIAFDFDDPNLATYVPADLISKLRDAVAELQKK